MANPQQIDVQQVMNRVREAVRRRRRSDAQTLEPLSASPNGFRSPDFGHLQSLGDLGQVTITSHRRFFGLVVVAAKRILLKLLTPTLAQQAAYNAAAVRAMADTDNRMHALEWRHDQATAASQEQHDANMAALRQEVLAAIAALREELTHPSRVSKSAPTATAAARQGPLPPAGFEGPSTRGSSG